MPCLSFLTCVHRNKLECVLAGPDAKMAEVCSLLLDADFPQNLYAGARAPVFMCCMISFRYRALDTDVAPSAPVELLTFDESRVMALQVWRPLAHFFILHSLFMLLCRC